MAPEATPESAGPVEAAAPEVAPAAAGLGPAGIGPSAMAVLGLQRAAGNAAVGRLMRSPGGAHGTTPTAAGRIVLQRKPSATRKRHPPEDATAMFAKAYPKVTFPADAIKSLQDVLDDRAAVKEVEEEIAKLGDSVASDDVRKRDKLQEEARSYGNSRTVSVNVHAKTVLKDDILNKDPEIAKRRPREVQAREGLYATLVGSPMKFALGEGTSPSLTMKWGPGDWLMPNDGGLVGFDNLMNLEKFKLAFDHAVVKDEIDIQEELLEMARSGLPYNMDGKKVGEYWGYVYNSSVKITHEMGKVGGYVDDARGRREMEGAGKGARIVLRNPADKFLHVYALTPFNSYDLKSGDKTWTGDAKNGSVYLYDRGSQVSNVVEISTADGFMLTPGSDGYGKGWGVKETLNDYEQFSIGAVLGDGFDDPSATMTFGQIVIGCVPVVGQVADARDVAIGLHKMWTTGGKDGKLSTALSLVGLIPLIGDGVKAAWKAGKREAGALTKATSKELAQRAVKEGAEHTAGAASKQLGERMIKNADEVAKALDIGTDQVKASMKGLEALGEAAHTSAKAAQEFGEGMSAQLKSLGGDAGTLVAMTGGDWSGLVKKLKLSPEGAMVGNVMEKWRTAQFAPLESEVAALVGNVGAEATEGAAPKMARTGTPSYTSDVDISFLGPSSTQHRNAAIGIMERKYGPGWRKLMDADIFADPKRLHLFDEPLKEMGATAGKAAAKRIITEAELNVYAKMLKDGVPMAEVKKLAAASGVEIAEVVARQKEITKLSTDYLAAELRKGTSKTEVEKMAKEMHIDMADVEKHLAGGENLYKELELELDALHTQFAKAEAAGDIAQQVALGEKMAAMQGKLNAAISGPYMTPGGGAKHVTRREKALRPGKFTAMSPILGYTAVLDDMYMLTHALPAGAFDEKAAKGMAKYGERLLVTGGQFGLEMSGSTKELFEDIAQILLRARLEKDVPDLARITGKLDSTKTILTGQLDQIAKACKENASEYIKNGGWADASSVEKTTGALGMQKARVAAITIKSEIPPEKKDEKP